MFFNGALKAQFKYRWLSNFSITPIISVKPMSADPPALMKGSGIPMIGISPIVMPMLMAK